MIPSEMRVFEAVMNAAGSDQGVFEFGHGPIVNERISVGSDSTLLIYQCERCGARVRRDSPEEFREYDCDELLGYDSRRVTSRVIRR